MIYRKTQRLFFFFAWSNLSRHNQYISVGCSNQFHLFLLTMATTNKPKQLHPLYAYCITVMKNPSLFCYSFFWFIHHKRQTHGQNDTSLFILLPRMLSLVNDCISSTNILPAYCQVNSLTYYSGIGLWDLQQKEVFLSSCLSSGRHSLIVKYSQCLTIWLFSIA